MVDDTHPFRHLNQSNTLVDLTFNLMIHRIMMKFITPLTKIVFVMTLSLTSLQATEPKILIKNGETIAFLGDSITAGGGGYGGYCRLVVHGLKSKGVYAKGVYAGIPGNTSADMLFRLDWAVLKHKPDWVFIAAGVNDIWHQFPEVKLGISSGQMGRGVKLERYKANMTQIVRRCREAGAKVMLSTLNPLTLDPKFKLNKIQEGYNAFLYELAKRNSLPIAQLNEAIYAKVAELKKDPANAGRSNFLTSDGVHPIGSGHKVMAEGILKTMGLTDTERTKVREEWNHSQKIVICGGRQVSSGGRTGGWYQMLLDGLNSGRVMISNTNIAKKGSTISELVEKAKREAGPLSKYLLLVPPLGDITKKTDTSKYRTSLQDLANLAKKRQIEAVFTTFPMVGSDEKGKINVGAKVYNEIIRKICKENSVTLLDIAALMNNYFKRHPDSLLNFRDERFNHHGATLFAEAAFLALGGDKKILPELHQIWADITSYTYKYSDMVHYEIPFSEEGKQALSKAQNQTHKINDSQILDLGQHLLLTDDVEKNNERVVSATRKWLSMDQDTETKRFRNYPLSANEKQAIESYLKIHKIEIFSFYQRAFLVGLHALNSER